MNRYIIFLLTLISIIKFSNCQIPGIGLCPNVNVVKNFDVQRYTGLWYEVQKYPFIFSIGGRCIIAKYTLNSDATLRVLNKQFRNGQEDSITGNAEPVASGIGSLTVTFPGSPFKSHGNYNIIYTDYQDLAVIFSCSSFLGFLNVKLVWILSRSRVASPESIEKAYQVLRDNAISTGYLVKTDQSNCPIQLRICEGT